MRWTSEQVLGEIRTWRDRGEPLYANHVRLNFQELLAASIRYFGSWQKAVETAGIPYEQVRKYRKWSNETIIQEIRDLHAQGVDLSFRAMALSQYNSMVYAAIRPKYFGSWKAALEAAGLESEEIYRYRSWEETDILEEIRRILAPSRWMKIPTASSPRLADALATGAARWSGPASTTRKFAGGNAGPANPWWKASWS
jgi:hypothetical protein